MRQGRTERGRGRISGARALEFQAGADKGDMPGQKPFQIVMFEDGAARRLAHGPEFLLPFEAEGQPSGKRLVVPEIRQKAVDAMADDFAPVPSPMPPEDNRNSWPPAWTRKARRAR